MKNKLINLRLPTSSGEKVTLGLTCFVAFSVFMLMVAEKVPATSDTVPIIGIYLTIVMSLTVSLNLVFHSFPFLCFFF